MSNNVSPTNRLNVLRVDASMRRSGSVTRELADDLIAVLEARDGGIALVNRDLTEGLPFIDESWIGANVTDPAERSDSQKERLALSDTLADELKAADVVVIASPIYNFNVPAAMKAWIDLIARARETFRYTENGPVGLLEGKKAYVVSASGGTEVGGEIDFAVRYLKHVLGFVGIHDVTVVAAERLMFGAEESVSAAKAAVAEIARQEGALAA
jgi:FMN-dependent NADH-azoreductase